MPAPGICDRAILTRFGLVLGLLETSLFLGCLLFSAGVVGGVTFRLAMVAAACARVSAVLLRVRYPLPLCVFSCPIVVLEFGEGGAVWLLCCSAAL